MLTRKKVILIGLIVMILIASTFFIVRSIATPFLSEEQLIQELARPHNRENIAIRSITDIIDIDKKHKVVLFVTDKERYGKSYWQWSSLERQWQHVRFSMFEVPELWMIDESDERSYVMIWHQSPDMKVKSYQLYLLKRRGYHVSMRGEEILRSVYEPQFQLEHSIELNGQASGIMTLPDEWINIMKQYNRAIKGNYSTAANLLFGHSTLPFTIEFSALDHNDAVIPETDLFRNSSFASGAGNIQVLNYPTEYSMD